MRLTRRGFLGSVVAAVVSVAVAVYAPSVTVAEVPIPLPEAECLTDFQRTVAEAFTRDLYGIPDDPSALSGPTGLDAIMNYGGAYDATVSP